MGPFFLALLAAVFAGLVTSALGDLALTPRQQQFLDAVGGNQEVMRLMKLEPQHLDKLVDHGFMDERLWEARTRVNELKSKLEERRVAHSRALQTCTRDGGSCSGSGSCCSLSCSGSLCACLDLGTACEQDVECCSGYCDPTNSSCVVPSLGDPCKTNFSDESNLSGCQDSNNVSCIATPNGVDFAGTCTLKTSSPTTSPSRAPVNHPSSCELHNKITQKQCALMMRKCQVYGLRYKWVKHHQGCPRSGTKGCQFAEFCGYTCREACSSDTACTWNGTSATCVNRA